MQGNERKFIFSSTNDVYTSESTALDFNESDIVVGIKQIGEGDPVRASKEQQIISLKKAIELSALRIDAFLPYKITDQLFIQQNIIGSDGDTTVSSFKNQQNNQQNSFSISNFENGGDSTNKKFKLEIEAEVLETTEQYKRTIRVKSKNAGKIDNLNLHSGTVSIANFTNFYISEGDLVNSYNIDNNARYNDNDIAFEES